MQQLLDTQHNCAPTHRQCSKYITHARAHTHRGTQPRLWLYHIVTPCMVMLVTPKSVTPHGYATYGYATVTPYSVTPHRYATHGYATCLCHLWSCRLRQIRLRHMVTSVTPRLRQIQLRYIVKPHVVTSVKPRLRQIQLRHVRLCRLRQAWLRHIVTPCMVTPVTPKSVTPHGYAT